MRNSFVYYYTNTKHYKVPPQQHYKVACGYRSVERTQLKKSSSGTKIELKRKVIL